MATSVFSKQVLELDCAAETEKIINNLRQAMRRLKRRGAVLGCSGGIDSSVCAALSVRAFGSERVVGLLMPEQHSADETLGISKRLTEHFGFESFHEDISEPLKSVNFYGRYAEAIKSVIPKYTEEWKSKIVIPNVADNSGFTYFSVVAVSPTGDTVKKRLDLSGYLKVVAATNFKQRIRKMLEYYYADQYNFAVIGTPNRQEYDQGFFVKLGDGAADLKPIAHLYKTQVYQMAEYLDVPEEIRKRPPTTDTYSLPQGQDEFYFSLPYDKMDLCLWGKNNDVEPGIVGEEIGLNAEQVGRVYKDIDVKRSTTRYMHEHPLLMGEVPEIDI